jgi:hypothetical protein
MRRKLLAILIALGTILPFTTACGCPPTGPCQSSKSGGTQDDKAWEKEQAKHEAEQRAAIAKYGNLIERGDLIEVIPEDGGCKLRLRAWDNTQDPDVQDKEYLRNWEQTDVCKTARPGPYLLYEKVIVTSKPRVMKIVAVKQTVGAAHTNKNACYLILRDGNGEVTSPKHSQEECDKLEAGQQYEGGVIEPQPLY